MIKYLTDDQLFELVAPVQEVILPDSIWRHKNGRNNYIIMCVALAEGSQEPVVVYRVNKFGSVPWVRVAGDFLKKFSPVPDEVAG